MLLIDSDAILRLIQMLFYFPFSQLQELSLFVLFILVLNIIFLLTIFLTLCVFGKLGVGKVLFNPICKFLQSI